MGCWDIFCFLCGNPSHGLFKDAKEEYLLLNKQYEDMVNGLIKKNNIFIKNFKKINNKNVINKIEPFIKQSKWMDKCSFLTVNNEIIHNVEEIACNISFVDKKNNLYIHSVERNNINELNGIFIHTYCWNYIKDNYKIKLNYSHLPIIKSNNIYKVFPFIDYGPIEKYWGQDFNFYQILADNQEKLCLDVDNRIKKSFNKLKIRIDEKRKGPLVSATFYKENTYKVGKDNFIYVIKNGKWNKLNDKFIYTKELDKSIDKLKYIGESSDKPIFIKNIEKKRNKFLVTILSNKLN